MNIEGLPPAIATQVGPKRSSAHELDDLIGHIIALVEQLFIAEKERYSFIHCPPCASLQWALQNSMKEFSTTMTRCSGEVQPISHLNKERLNFIVRRLTNLDSPIPRTALQASELIQNTFCAYIRTFSKRRSDSVNNLVPSDFYGERSQKCRPQKRSAKEVERFTPDQLALKGRIITYLQTKKELLNPVEKEIICYLEGSSDLEEIGVTRANGRLYLMTAKVIDQALAEQKYFMARSSYELRSKILKLCSPSMTTSVAFTKTLDPKKMNDRHYLRNSYAWVPERVARHAKIVANELIHVVALSRRLNRYVTSDLVVRGPTAAGKSQIIARDPLFRQALDDRGEMPGVLNLDNIKFRLKNEKPTDRKTYLGNNQVHAEAVFYHRFRDEIREKARYASVIIEGRLSTLEELDTVIFGPAKKRNSEISMLDLATPLACSLHAVLTRDPFGKDPCPPLQDIVKGYQESILYRSALIARVKEDNSIRYFKFYFTDKHGSRHLVAEKMGSDFHVYSEQLLQDSYQPPSENEIEQELNQLITSDYLEKVSLEFRPAVQRWLGVTLAKAVEMHATGLPLQEAMLKIKEEAIWQEKYGMSSQQPFTGAWLQDYPAIIAHLRTEQLLHIRGVDDKGYGLHWQSNKFSTRLNPKYRPEAMGGFQMKVGYFIIPLDHIETYRAPSLSPNVLKELEERDVTGQLIGYRFFVHPEAYPHFKSLHEANIPFVTPLQSPFIGTPTSSYRSWAVRRVSEENGNLLPQPNTVPFIIKLGVASDPTDLSRLLPQADVERSIKTQMAFDKMEKSNSLLIFPESLGLVLKNIANYPPSSLSQNGELLDSGIIIREFPQPLLDGEYQIFSFSALMSVERIKKENQGIGSPEVKNGLQALPLIYECLAAAIRKGLVKDTMEYIETYLIKGYFQAIEGIAFKEGLSFSPHAQNLCLVLDREMIPIGMAIRDHEGMPQDMHSKYIETYTWFYRYHVMVKLLNVLTCETINLCPPGAPLQFGYRHPLKERCLVGYWRDVFQKTQQEQMLLTLKQHEDILTILDDAYVSLLCQYFDLDRAKLLQNQKHLPAAESGSLIEDQMLQYNADLWENRLDQVPQTHRSRPSLHLIPDESKGKWIFIRNPTSTVNLKF